MHKFQKITKARASNLRLSDKNPTSSSYERFSFDSGKKQSSTAINGGREVNAVIRKLG